MRVCLSVRLPRPTVCRLLGGGVIVQLKIIPIMHIHSLFICIYFNRQQEAKSCCCCCFFFFFFPEMPPTWLPAVECTRSGMLEGSFHTHTHTHTHRQTLLFSFTFTCRRKSKESEWHFWNYTFWNPISKQHFSYYSIS